MKPSDPTIVSTFNIYRFADHKKKGIDLRPYQRSRPKNPNADFGGSVPAPHSFANIPPATGLSCSSRKVVVYARAQCAHIDGFNQTTRL